MQLEDFCGLLAPNDVLEVLAPIYLDLLQDVVERVRVAAYRMSERITFSSSATFAIINKSIEADNQRGAVMIFRIITFAKSTKYNTREVRKRIGDDS